MSIFGPTISWDPREPLPVELQRPKGNLATRKYDASCATKRTITGNAPFHVMNYVQPQPENLAAKQIKLPDFTTEEGGQNLLAPWSIEIDASIVQDTASVQATQVFWNNSTALIPQGTYTFPLPTGCSVTEFICQVGSRVLKGTVKPKKEAQEAFNDHVAAGRMAGLLEQDTTEIFSATLGNIPPDTRVTVKISYITLLKYHLVSGQENKETSTFTIPTCIASRYGPVPRFAGTTTTDIKQGLTLNIKVLDSRVIHKIRSSTHKIKVEERAEVRVANSWADLADEQSGKVPLVHESLIQLDQGPIFLDKDFVLEILVDVGRGNAAPEAWIEHHPTDPNQAALMAILPPGLLNQIPKPPPRQREILFLVDQSGSMDDKIDSLKSAMHFFLKGIPLGSKFNIARFGSAFTSWCPQSVQYSGESLEAALGYVSSSIDANMGGTEILGAVESILGSRDTGMWTDIIVLTDGQVWRLDELLATVKDARKASGNSVRFFCLGIGDQVSHALVEGIASMGGGYAEVVPASEQDSWESKLLSMEAASVENDPIGEVKMYLETCEGKAINCPSSAISPSELQNLNPFIRNRVYMLFDSEVAKDFRSLVLAIALPDGTQSEQRFPLQLLQGGRDTTIHKLAARSLLNDLEHGQSSCDMMPNFLMDSQAETLACKWSLASKWTSFFLGEEAMALEGTRGSLIVISSSRKTPDLLEKRDPQPVLGGSYGYCPTIEMGVPEPDCMPTPNWCLERDLSLALSPRQPCHSSIETGSMHSRRGFPANAPRKRGRPSKSSLEESDSRKRRGHVQLGPNILDTYLPRVETRGQGEGKVGGGDSSLKKLTITCNKDISKQDETTRRHPDVDKTTLKGDREQNFLMHLLGHQRFDGSFEFGTDEDFIHLLGQDTFDAVASLADITISRSLYFTVAVIVVLEQHFAPQKLRWHMMHSKASAYIKGASGRLTGNEMDVVRDGLQGVKSPLDQVGLQLEQKDRKRGRQGVPSECAEQAGKRLRETPLRDQADKDLQCIQHSEVVAPGGDQAEDSRNMKSDAVTRQPRRVIEIAPSD